MRLKIRFALISIGAIVLVACGLAQESTPPAVDADPFRLATNVAPIAQQLTLNIDPDQANYSGTTTITIEVASEAPEIRLHAQDMQITSLTVATSAGILDVTHEFGEHGLLIISAGQAFAAGTYELRIEFSNDFNTDGTAINRTELEGRHYIFSQFEATDARQAFPCFDEPSFKFPWQLTMTVPYGITPITNTPEVSVTEEGGQKTVVFDTTPPLPSYLIAVAVGPFETVAIDGMSIPGRVVVPHGKTHLAVAAVETTPALLAYLEDYFGEPYPFKKLDLIATNQAFSGAMEHPGAITYSDFLLLLDDTASASQRTTLIKITAHELAHQWFGNLVTMQWWNDLWLNESFADWMGDKTAEAVYPDFSAELPELRTMFRVMDLDLRSTTKPIRHDFKSTANFRDGIFLSYYKGKAVIGMFERAVGPEIFRDGVVRYLRKYSRGNAQAKDLWAEINAGAEFDLAGGLAGFINQPGIPLVTVTNAGDGRFEFSQNRIQAGVGAAKTDEEWVIPLSYKYLSGDGVKTADLVIDGPSEIVALDATVVWILPNADQRGYYRWSIPDDMLATLGDDAASHLNVRERMGLLTNLWALLSSDKLDGDDYLAAMRGIASDTDPDVINALLDQLGTVLDTFITPQLRAPFAAFLREILTPTLDRIGTEAIAGEPESESSLRPRVLLWLADYGRDDQARAVVSTLTRQYLAGEIPQSNMVNVAIRTEARWGGPELFEVYRERFEAANSPGERRSFVRAIGSFRDPVAVEQVLDYILNGALGPNDVRTVLGRLLAWPDNNEMLLAWAMQHDTELRDIVSEGAMVNLPGQLMLCSTENLEMIREFYSAPERFVAGIEDELNEEVAEKIECANFRQREIDSVRAYLGAS